MLRREQIATSNQLHTSTTEDDAGRLHASADGRVSRERDDGRPGDDTNELEREKGITILAKIRRLTYRA